MLGARAFENGNAGRETLAEEFDDLLPRHARVAAARATERFAECARENVHAAHHVAMLVRAAARAAHEADGVRVVDHDERAVFVREIADAAQVGDVTVHRENTIGRDHLETRAFLPGLAQLCFEIREVVVFVTVTLRLAEPHSVDDRGVI